MIDLTEMSGEQKREEIARELAAEEGQRRFDLSRGPVVRAKPDKREERAHIVM